MNTEWTAHPARRRPQDLALVAMVTFVFCGAVMVSLQSAFLAALAAAILLVAIAPFLFPTRYRLGDEGVSETRLGRTRIRSWSQLRRVQVGPGAVLVSPFARPHVLDRYRGMILYLDGADRDRVTELLKAKIEARGGADA